MIDISLIVPSIRPHNWQRFLNSVQNSCTKYNWEVVFIGPFNNERAMENLPIKWIKSYDTVPVCLQLGSREASGKLIFHTVDDGLLLPNSLDLAIDFYNTNCYNDILNCRYTEGPNFSGRPFPENYWKAGYYPQHYGQKYVDPTWNLSVQPLLLKRTFIEFGGLDCSFGYSNHPHIDANFRWQQAGLAIINSPTEITIADHMPGLSGDHAPICNTQEGPDSIKFNELWNSPRKTKIPYDNFIPFLGTWKARFKKEYSTYEEMCVGEGY